VQKNRSVYSFFFLPVYKEKIMNLLQNILEVLLKDVIFYKLVTNKLFTRLRIQKGNQPTSEKKCAKIIRKVRKCQ
jgi:hypothetical protein